MNRRDFIQRSAALVGAAYVGVPGLATDLQTLGNPNLVIGVLSDIHVQGPENADTFVHALEYFRSLRVDGVIIAGDMADHGLEPQLQAVADAWFNVFPDNKGLDGKYTEKLFIYGNHDVQASTWGSTINKYGAEYAKKHAISNDVKAAWKRCFKEEYSPIWIKEVKGYRFIGAHWHNSNIPGLSEFLAQHSTELGTEKPFFYIQHPHPRNTCNGFWAWGRDDGNVTKILSRYSNAVAFSGHSHSPLNDDRNFWQDKFTSIGTSSLSYLYPMPARENTHQDDWGGKPPTQMADIGGEGRQGMVMRVYDGAIAFERREFVNDQAVADPWVMPWPISQSEPLTFENRKKTSPVPQFAKDAKVKVSQAYGKDRYGKEQEQVTVQFPNIFKKDTGVRAFDYEVQVEHEWLDVRFISVTKRVMSPRCFMDEGHDAKEAFCVFGLSELPTLFRYRFIVRPCECFGKKGEPLYSDWISGPIKSITSSISIPKMFYKAGDNIEVSFKDAPVGTKAWIGLYSAGSNPGSGNKSLSWDYTQVKEGKMNLKYATPGEYYLVMFRDSGYGECSVRIPVYLTANDYDPSAFSLTMSKSVYGVGAAIPVVVSGAPALSRDWVGIYSAENDNPMDVICPTYLYYESGSRLLRLNVSGTKNWKSPLEKGIYYVNYFMTGGYTEPFPRKYFVIGKPATVASERASYGKDEPVVLSFNGSSEKLKATICYQTGSDTTFHEAQALTEAKGIAQIEGLAPGDYKFYVCVDGSPFSEACSVKVENSGTAVNGVQANRPNDNIAYRMDGTRAGRADERLEHGIYIINGEKRMR